MKYLFKNNGFTLIEILVGINIGFLLITVIVTFFLFSTKFVATTTKNLEQRQNINDSLFRLGNTLRKAEHFYIQPNDSFTLCVINDRDTISLSRNSLSLMNLYKIDGIAKYNVVLNLISGEQVTISDGILEANFIGKQNSIILSSEIDDMLIEFKLKEQLYDFRYITPNTSANRFRNISK